MTGVIPGQDSLQVCPCAVTSLHHCTGQPSAGGSLWASEPHCPYLLLLSLWDSICLSPPPSHPVFHFTPYTPGSSVQVGLGKCCFSCFSRLRTSTQVLSFLDPNPRHLPLRSIPDSPLQVTKTLLESSCSLSDVPCLPVSVSRQSNLQGVQIPPYHSPA